LSNLEFEIDRQSLEIGLSKVRNAIATKDIVPVLKSLYIAINKDALVTLRASNIELSAEAQFYAESSKQLGAVCVPGREFVRDVSLLPAGRVKIRARDGGCDLKSSKSELTLATSDASDFPAFPDYELRCNFGKGFLEGLKYIAPSMTQDAVRVAMRGVYVEGDGKGALRLCASNNVVINHGRVVQSKVEAPLDGTTFFPDNFVTELLRMGPEEFGFFESDTMVGAEFHSDDALCKLVHRKFGAPPLDYRPIIENLAARKKTASVTLDAQTLRDVCRRSAVVCAGDPKVITSQVMIVKFDGDQTGVARSSAQLDSLEDRFTYKGKTKSFEIALSPQYMLDYLESISVDAFTLSLLGESTLHLSAKNREQDYWVALSRVQDANAR
jgi:DNA polymerase III sliding clamp (beta) subunit (PCNA family)